MSTATATRRKPRRRRKSPTPGSGEALAHNIGVLLNEKDMSRAELARRIGVHKSYISELLIHNMMPKGDRLYLISKALRTSIGKLLGYC